MPLSIRNDPSSSPVQGTPEPLAAFLRLLRAKDPLATSTGEKRKPARPCSAGICGFKFLILLPLGKFRYSRVYLR